MIFCAVAFEIFIVYNWNITSLPNESDSKDTYDFTKDFHVK